MRHKLNLLWLLCFLLTAVRTLPADTGETAAEQLRYRETTGERSSVKHYSFAPAGPGYTLRLTHGDIEQEIRCDSSYHTLTERYIRADAGDNVTVRREADTLVFSGKLGGRPVGGQAAVGNEIWYGSKLLLRGFILSQKKTEIFYMSRPEEQKVIKLRAEKQGLKKITVCGAAYTAVKVTCTLPDYPLVPWKSFFWYRASDGVLLKSEERRGPPWKPLSVVELTGETRQHPNRGR